MAEGFLRSFDAELEVFSAGTKPSSTVHPLAVEVMLEAGIDISGQHPKSVGEFVQKPFDWVITVCAGAKESCPVFVGSVRHRRHIGFDDPAEAEGSPDEVLAVFRRVRDEIRDGFRSFYNDLSTGG